MTTRKFKVVMERDPEDNVWVTYVPTLNGISTFGDTREEAIEMTREAILGYLESLEQLGLPLPPADPDVEVLELEVGAA